MPWAATDVRGVTASSVPSFLPRGGLCKHFKNLQESECRFEPPRVQWDPVQAAPLWGPPFLHLHNGETGAAQELPTLVVHPKVLGWDGAFKDTDLGPQAQRLRLSRRLCDTLNQGSLGSPGGTVV